MAARNEEVLDFVQTMLSQQPGIGTRELYRMVNEQYPSLEEMSPQQFHGRYYLTAKRALAPRRENGAPSARKKAIKAKKAATPRKQGKRDTAKVAAPAVETVPSAPAATTLPRERVRAVFLQFARDFAGADSRADIVHVLSKVDDYVDQVVSHS